VDWLRSTSAAGGFIHEDDLELMHLTDDVAEAVDVINAAAELREQLDADRISPDGFPDAPRNGRSPIDRRPR
jgi:predicted Rossmann-fold nucleotide-binding protein